jgi:hypothetical protein
MIYCIAVVSTDTCEPFSSGISSRYVFHRSSGSSSSVLAGLSIVTGESAAVAVAAVLAAAVQTVFTSVKFVKF